MPAKSFYVVVVRCASSSAHHDLIDTTFHLFTLFGVCAALVESISRHWFRVTFISTRNIRVSPHSEALPGGWVDSLNTACPSNRNGAFAFVNPTL